MTKYARKKLYGSQARLIDVVEVPNPLPPWAADDSAFLNKMYAPFRAEWEANEEWFVAVPDDALAGATDDGDGTYTNPSDPAGPSRPVELGDRAFRKLCQGTIGFEAFGNIITAARESDDGNARGVYAAWLKAETFSKSDVESLTTKLVDAEIMTSEQRTTLLGGWPVW